MTPLYKTPRLAAWAGIVPRSYILRDGVAKRIVTATETNVLDRVRK